MEERVHRYTGGEYRDEPFKYRLLRPDRPAPGAKYPVVLFLHGAGERGDDNRTQLAYFPEQMARPEWRSRFPCFLIAPQCREGRWWSSGRGMISAGNAPSPPSDQLQVALEILLATLDDPLADRDRVYLTGLSMGGYGAWELAARRPELFAALAPICGGGDPSQARRLKSLPIWAFHGELDDVVPVSESRSMIAAIRAAGGKPKYTELPGVGHHSWQPAYAEASGLVPWMFMQAR